MRKPNKQLIHCAECGRNKRHHAKGLCKACYSRQWSGANPEKTRGANQRYRGAHREERRECDREYYEAHQEERVEYDRQYREAHRKERREYNRQYSCQWAKTNPDKRRENERRRRARKNGASIGPVDEAVIYKRDGHMCIYCGATEDLTLDHIAALGSGGPHCEGNLLVACGRCNSSKGTKPLEDWLQTQPKSIVWVM